MTSNEPPEEIDGLVFQPNPDYPYPFAVPQPPRFWMEEQTGVLADAVEAYMNGMRLTPAQVAVIQRYLRQYLERAVLADGADRQQLLGRIARLRDARGIEAFADEIAEYGVEPF